MHKKVILSLVAFFILLFFFASPDVHGALVGKVSLVEGRADVLKVGTKAMTHVKPNAPVDIGDIIRVKSDGRVEITFFDGGIVRIGPASRVEIKDYSSDARKTNNIIRLATGHVQVITGKTFIQKVSQFTEGNKFEVHTPNATAGVRGSNMVVSFIRSVTTTLFIDGKGYQYNPSDPTGTRVTIVKGEISFVHAPLAPPTSPRKASPTETTQIIKTVTVTPPGQSGGPGTGGTGAPPSGTPGTGGATTSSSGSGSTSSSGTSTSGTSGTSGTSTGSSDGTSAGTSGTGATGSTSSTVLGTGSTTLGATTSTSTPADTMSSSSGFTTVMPTATAPTSLTNESTLTTVSTPLVQTTSPTSTTIGSNTIVGITVTTLPTIPVTVTEPATSTTSTTPAAPLTVSITGPSSATTQTSSTIEITSSAPATFVYTLDGGASTPMSGSTVTLNGLAEGGHTFAVSAMDTYGRTATGSASWTVDLTSPVLSIPAKPALLTNSSTAAFSFSATDATSVTYQYSTDGGITWASTGPALTLTGLTEGGHSVSIRGIDAAGNMSTPTIYAWTTDYTAPSPVTVAGAPTLTKLNSATITLTGMEAGAAYQYSTDGGSTWTATSGTISLTGLPEGTQNLKICATDPAGNVTTQLVSWITDYTAPVISTFTKASAPSAGATANFTVNTTTGEASDSAYAIDAGAYTTVTGTSFTANVPAGSHTLSFKAIDGAGNESGVTDILFTLNRYSLLGSTYGTGSTLSGTAAGDVAEIPAQPWGSWLISMTGAYTGPSSPSWQTTSGGTMTDLSSANTGYWLSQGSGTYAGNVMTGTSTFSYITGLTLGGGTGIITGAHDATSYTVIDTGSNLTATPLTAVSEVNTDRYALQNTGALTAGTAVATGSGPQFVTVDPTGRFAYVTNGSSNTVSVYTINQGTGALTAGTAVATEIYPQSIAIDSTGRFAYVANNTSNTVSVYTISQTTGALTAATAVATESNPHHIAVDPTGRFAYVANYGSGSISIYTINPITGALTAAGTAATGVWPSSVVVDPTGRFAYVSSITPQTISVYTINPITGALTAGGTAATGVWPLSVNVDPTARFAYAANYGSGSISIYTINPITGALTAAGTIATNNPYYISFDPAGKYAYVTNGNPSPATISTFAINQTTGALTAAGTIPTTALYPQSIVVDPTGRYVYVSHEGANTVSVYSIAALTPTPDGTMTAYMGTTANLWTATSGSPAAVTAIGTHSGTTTGTRLFTTNVGSYNYTAGNTTTYDGGAYKGYMAGISNGTALAAQMVALYIDPSGNAGYLTGNLSGTAYTDISMFSMTGSAYPTQVAAATGIAPVSLDTAATEQTGSVATSGTIGTGGWFKDIYSTGTSFKTLSIADGTTALPWGIYNLTTYGAFLTPSSGTSVTANLGGGSTPFGKYYDGAALQPDTGYWLAAMGPGSWSGSTITATLTGTYISKTRLGVLNGGVLGTYDTAWQMNSIGTWLGTPLKAVSEVNATRYNLQTTGELTGGSTVDAGAGPRSVTFDPTGRFAYVSNQGDNTVSVFTIEQSTGALTAVGTAVGTGTAPTRVAVDPTGRFAYVTNLNSNTISVYTIDQMTGGLTALGTPVAAGGGPRNVVVDPTGRFAYVTNNGSNTVSMYTIDQSTGVLTALGTPVAAGTTPWSVCVDPTGRFAYVTNYGSGNVSVYTINQSTGALTALGTPVAAGSQPYGMVVDPTGRFAYVANGGSNTVSMYTIDQSTGVLTALGTPVGTGTMPVAVTVDPTGKFAYVTNNSSNTVYVYTIDQSTGSLIMTFTAATGTTPGGVSVDPAGKFAYVANQSSNTISIFSIDAQTRTTDGTLTAYIGSTTSLFNGGTTPVTMIGTYNPTTPASFIWGQQVNSYNYLTGQNTTYDTPANAYAGFLTGYKADDNAAKAKWASLYVKADGSAGIILGSLAGNVYPGISMLKLDGSLSAPVEMAAAGTFVFTPANLLANIGTGSYANGTPLLNSGTFGAGGTLLTSYYQREYIGIIGQPWNVWKAEGSGTYAGTTSNDWLLSIEHIYPSLKDIRGTDMTGTSWSGNKIEGTTIGYSAEWHSTNGSSWVAIGDVIGTYDPAALTFQITSAGSAIHVDKFLAMTVTEATKLQALNIPCVQVGSVNLTGSTNYGTGTVNVTMNNTKFFATNSGAPAQLWATGTSQMGSWTGTAPPSNTSVAISGGGLTANFNFKAFDTAVTNKWGAAITNGTGGFNGSTTFRGAAAGTINTGAGTFSGSAAGVAK